MQHRSATLVFLTFALLTSLGWPDDCAAQTKIPRVGILTVDMRLAGDQAKYWWEPFRRTLAQQGWIEGKSVSFEYGNVRTDPSRFADAAAELVQLNVDVIWAPSAPAVRAAHAATRTIPIVALDATTDPVTEGYVESYNRPGGNITGVFLDAPEIAGKWFELLHAMVPGLSRVAVLWDPSPGNTHLQAVRNVAQSLGLQLQTVEVRKPEDLEAAFSTFKAKRAQALIILPSPMLYVQNEALAKLAMKYRLPATSIFRLFAESGGTMSYGHHLASAYERTAVLVAKVLDGAKPANLPVERPSKFELIVNLQAAKSLGLTVPDSMLVRADEVIR